jgi:AcrR family transcriptional regulator
VSVQEDNVSNHEGITDDVRKREEEYFRRKDRELLESMRKRELDAATRKDLEDATGIHDPEQIQELQALGFTLATVTLLPLLPVLQVAWAEGGVSSAERAMIINLARAREIVAGSPADAQLQVWLDEKPSEATFRKAARLISAILDHPAGSQVQVKPDDLLQYCEQIAHASGGLFGIGAVSAEEKKVLQQIASVLKAR